MVLWLLLCGLLLSLPARAWSPMVDRDQVQADRLALGCQAEGPR